MLSIHITITTLNVELRENTGAEGAASGSADGGGARNQRSGN